MYICPTCRRTSLVRPRMLRRTRGPDLAAHSCAAAREQARHSPAAEDGADVGQGASDDMIRPPEGPILPKNPAIRCPVRPRRHGGGHGLPESPGFREGRCGKIAVDSENSQALRKPRAAGAHVRAAAPPGVGVVPWGGESTSEPGGQCAGLQVRRLRGGKGKGGGGWLSAIVSSLESPPRNEGPVPPRPRLRCRLRDSSPPTERVFSPSHKCFRGCPQEVPARLPSHPLRGRLCRWRSSSTPPSTPRPTSSRGCTRRWATDAPGGAGAGGRCPGLAGALGGAAQRPAPRFPGQYQRPAPRAPNAPAPLPTLALPGDERHPRAPAQRPAGPAGAASALRISAVAASVAPGE